MTKGLLVHIVVISSLLFTCNLAICLDSGEIIRLKKAGISDETIQVMVREKSKETCAITVKEVLALKKAGLCEETIQMVIEESSFTKDAEPIVYGNDTRPLTFTTAKDLIELKDAGMSDEVIQALIVFGARATDDSEREKAWEMLTNMGILLDKRGRK